MSSGGVRAWETLPALLVIALAGCAASFPRASSPKAAGDTGSDGAAENAELYQASRDPRPVHASGLVMEAGGLDLPRDRMWLPGSEIAWTRKASNWDACVVGDRFVVLGTESDPMQVVALEPTSGAQLWAHASAAELGEPGLCEALGAELVLVRYEFVLIALDARDGRERWRFESRTELVGIHPQAHGVVLRLFNHKADASSIVALSSTGAERWRRDCMCEILTVDDRALVLSNWSDDGELEVLAASDGHALAKTPANRPTWVSNGIALYIDWDASSFTLRAASVLAPTKPLWTRVFRTGMYAVASVGSDFVVITDSAVRRIDASTGVERWAIALTGMFTPMLRPRAPGNATWLKVDETRLVLNLSDPDPSGFALVIDVEHAEVVRASHGALLTHAYGEYLLSARGAVWRDRIGPAPREQESLAQDLDRNVATLRSDVAQRLQDPAMDGEWSAHDAKTWLRALLDGLPEGPREPVRKRLTAALRQTYVHVPTTELARLRALLLWVLDGYVKDSEAAQLATETARWTLHLRTDMKRAEGGCVDEGVSDQEHDRCSWTENALRAAHHTLSASVADPAPLDALETAVFAQPSAEALATQSPEDRARMILAQHLAFPDDDVSGALKTFAPTAVWLSSHRSPGDTPDPKAIMRDKLGNDLTRDLHDLDRGDPEWDGAPTLRFDLLDRPRCVGPFSYELKQVRGRFRVIERR